MIIATYISTIRDTEGITSNAASLKALYMLARSGKAEYNVEDDSWTVAPLKIKVRHHSPELFFERIWGGQ